MSAAVPPTPSRPFGPDTLACALTLTGRATPTAAELAIALAELFPGGTGPTVPDLLADGWLAPTIDGRGLRVPPPTPAEQDARLAATEEPNKTQHLNALALADSGENVRSSRQLFSYYQGGITATVPYAAITPAQLYGILTSPQYHAQTEALRAAPVGSPQRTELKKRFDYVTPAATFTRRANDALNGLSGLLVLDFDHLPDLSAARAALLADELLGPELVLLFTSPSGDGLKALVRTDPTATHLDNFRAWADYLAGHYASLGLCADEAGKDVARACFVPYAPDAWLAPAYAA